MHLNPLLLVLPALALCSCVGQPTPLSPNARSALDIPQRFDTPQPPVPQITQSLSKVFPDPQLQRLVKQALQNNPDLRASAARLEEAGFNTRKSQAGLPPSVTGNASANRFRNNPSGFGASTNENYTATLDAQWEVDVWGRIRAGITAAASNQLAAQADYNAARQSIAAQTSQAYFSLIASTKQLALTAKKLQTFEQTYRLVNRRFETGSSDLGELNLARTDLENARSEYAGRKNQRDQSARRLSTLTGSYPDRSLTASKWPSLSRSIPAGLPSSLLLARPDIDAAYQRIRASDANVTVAHRDLFPRFNLTGSLGQQSSTLSKLADSNFNAWSILGGLSAPLIDGGQRRAELGAANARAKQSLANYQSTVLNALNEVENALGSEDYLRQQETYASRALTAARGAQSRIQRNYENGLVEILTLLDSQRRTFSTEENLINIRNQRYQNRVSLALALGKAL